MVQQMTDSIKKRKINERSLANLTTKGRPKGAKNKWSADVKKMVLDTLNKKGGTEFFDKLKDHDFLKVVAKLVPQVIDANVSGNMNQTVKIITSGEGKEK
jgi:hypothetical protein